MMALRLSFIGVFAMPSTPRLLNSLTGRTLLYIATGMTLIVLFTSALNYHLTKQEVESNLRAQMQDQIHRIGSSQDGTLLLARDLTVAVRDIALAELTGPPKYDVDQRYHELFMRYPDGAIRNRPAYGDGTRFATLWAPKSTLEDAMFRRLFVLFYDLCQQHGPLMRTRFFNFFFVIRNGANIGFDPDQPNWVYDAAADYDPTDQMWVNIGWPENNPERRTLFTHPERDPIPNRYGVSEITPLDLDGRYLGSLGLTINYTAFTRELSENVIPHSTQVLFRADGLLIAHPDHTRDILESNGTLKIRDLDDPRLAMLQRETLAAATLPVVGYDAATDQYYAVAHLQGAEWYTASLVPGSVVHERAFAAARWVLWTALLSLALLIALLAVILNRQIARPLRGLAGAAKRVAGGDLSARLPIERNDEVGELTEALNDMTAQLQLREDTNAAEKAELATALDATRTAETRFRALIEYAADVILVVDENGVMRFVAPSVEKAMGYTVEEWLGQSGFSFIHPDDRAMTMQALNRLLSQPDTMVTGLEYRVRHKDGTWQYYAATAINQLANPSVRGIVVNLRNIGEEKRYEEEMQKQREALYQSEKLTAMGALLAGVAHELNNPLSIVVGRALMLEAEARDEQTRASLEKLRSSTERCARIVKTFLAMARNHKPEREICNVNDILQLALDITGYSLKSSGVELQLELDPELPDIDADPDQLHQVFVNLLINAQQALAAWSGERRLVVRTRHDRLHDTVAVTISDSGPGVPANLRGRIFEPFFTTKPSGTGIGLSVSQGLVTANNGSMTLDEIAAGASFTVAFPAVRQERLAAGAAVGRTADNGGAREIVVVDDDEDVREMIRDMLVAEGHRVHLAADARQALRILHEHPVEAIVSDIRMPGLDGPGLYQALAAIAPEMRSRIIFVTGDALSGDVQAFLRDSGCPHLEKPITPADLSRAVRSLALPTETV